MGRSGGIRFFLTRLGLDLLFVPISFLVAYVLKFKIAQMAAYFGLSFGLVYEHAQIEPYLGGMWLILFVYILSFYFVGLYKPVSGLFPAIDEFFRVLKGVSLASMQLVVVSFFYQSFPGSRFVIVYAWVIGIALVFLGRGILILIEVALLRRGIGARRALVIGTGKFGQDIVEKIMMFPLLRLRYVGSLGDDVPDVLHFHLRRVFQFLGSPESFSEVCESEGVDVIFVSETAVSNAFMSRLVAYSESCGIELRVVSDVANWAPLSQLSFWDGVPVFSTKWDWPLMGLVFKQVFDMVGSFLLLVLLSPLLLGISVYIKLVSPRGPVFYLQERVGKGGRVFGMLKFRSMVPDAELGTGPVMVNENGDDRYIRGGAFLRKWSLDELPQLWNVFVGDMSLVGPRPERPHFVALFVKSVPYYDLRHRVKGGITGWAQINGRSVLTRRPEHKVKYDIYYIKHWSFLLDLKILLRTLVLVFRQEEAY